MKVIKSYSVGYAKWMLPISFAVIAFEIIVAGLTGGWEGLTWIGGIGLYVLVNLVMFPIGLIWTLIKSRCKKTEVKNA